MNCHAWRHGNINAAKCSARIEAFELLIMAFGYWIRHHMPCFLSFTSWPCMRGRRSWKSLKSLLTLFAIGNFCAFLWVKIAIFCLNGDCAKGMSCMFIILIRFIASNLNFTTNSPQSIDFFIANFISKRFQQSSLVAWHRKPSQAARDKGFDIICLFGLKWRVFSI